MKKPKYTVNLPKTNFPMKADLPQREPGTLSLWERLRLYEKLLAQPAPKGDFILHDGPPYANGRIHMGHALNKILKDIIVKYKSMSGYHAPYVPGWDCHGLPIEHQLMKEKGWDKRKVGRVPFRKEAEKFAEHFIDLQRREFKRLGVLGDWEHPYKTLSPDYEASIVRTFYDLLEKGFIYRDKKPVYWCASCETALAEAEVEYEEKNSPSIYVKFPVLEWPGNPEAQALAKQAGKRLSVLVWTTTPWTLPANVALAFHPEQTYKLWEAPDGEKILVGDPGWAFLEQTLGKSPREPFAIDGLSLEGLLCKNPLNNNESQGVLAEFVSKEEGSGVVHIAPGHGQEDYGVGREYGLPTLSPVADDGRFADEVLPNVLKGQKVWDANAVIIELLAKSRLLVKEQKITHSYPHCWRCKNPIIFRATEQWFLRVDDAFRRKLIASTDDVAWTPDYGKERLLGMLKTRPDWCLARQRYWGTPIPMFYCESCKEPVKNKDIFNIVVELFRKNGSNAWYEKEPKDILPPNTKCSKCGKTSFRKEDDILDVWFDSGVSWAAVLRDRMKIPDRENVMYLEGSDQHRGWFQTSLLPAMALTEKPPYKHVLTHGFVLDGEGRAMSKSQGNVIAPQEIMEKHGADIVRLWVAMTDYREDVRLSQPILDRVIDTYRKIRNTLRFLLGNLSGFGPAKVAVPYEKMETLDRGVLASLHSLAADVRKNYDNSEFHLVSNKICNDFCINLLSAFYLDVRKDILYCDRPDSPRRRSAQTAFLEISKTLAQLLAPLLSFTAEEVWRTLSEQKLLSTEDNADSILLNPFASAGAVKKEDLDLFNDLANLKTSINSDVEKERQSGNIKGANDTHVILAFDKGSRLSRVPAAELASYMNVAKITIEESGPSPVLKAAPGTKCPRCWVWREDVNESGLCGRCADAEKFFAEKAAQEAS
ncbi:MAG TPA: isoleucine--tRNA ligase [Elusimicrobiota bacterium]|nr:isoleucine--tRNA ligase [Elusimicrobiota bacterium]